VKEGEEKAQLSYCNKADRWGFKKKRHCNQIQGCRFACCSAMQLCISQGQTQGEVAASAHAGCSREAFLKSEEPQKLGNSCSSASAG